MRCQTEAVAGAGGASRGATPDGNRAYLRWLWERFGEPASLGPAACLVFLPFSLIGPVILEPARSGLGPGAALALGIVAQGVLTAVMLGGRALIHRAGTPRSRPWATLAVIEIAVAVRALVLGWITVEAGGATSLELSYRLTAAFLANAGVLAVIALVMSSLAYHRRIAGELRARQAALDELTASMRDRLDREEADLAQQVRMTVEPLVRDIDAQLTRIAEDGAPSAALTASIRELVDDQLRPLSHRLAGGSGVHRPADLPLTADTTRSAGVPVPTHLLIGQVLRPVSASALVMAVLIPQGLRILGPQAGLRFAVVTGFALLGLLAALKAILRRVRAPFAVAVVAGGSSYALALLVALDAAQVLGVAMAPRLELAAWLLGGMLGALAATFVAVNAQRDITEGELRRSIAELEVASGILRRRSFLTQRRLAYVVHGSVQGALHAASMRLSGTDHPDAALIATIRADISSAMAKLDMRGSPYQFLVDVLDDIAELWDGTCSVRWSMDHRTVRILAGSPDAATSVAEVARECVANAIRHGGASEVTIAVTGSGETVLLTATDDGRGIDPAAAVGLGTRMLDELCVTWRREQAGPGTRLTVTIAAPQGNGGVLLRA